VSNGTGCQSGDSSRAGSWGEPARAPAAGVHAVDLLLAVAVGGEQDLPPVGRQVDQRRASVVRIGLPSHQPRRLQVVDDGSGRPRHDPQLCRQLTQAQCAISVIQGAQHPELAVGDALPEAFPGSSPLSTDDPVQQRGDLLHSVIRPMHAQSLVALVRRIADRRRRSDHEL